LTVQVMGKEAILQTKQVEHVRNERQLLGLLRHPFIVQFYASFQDTRNVYLGMFGTGRRGYCGAFTVDRMGAAIVGHPFLGVSFRMRGTR
jgi:hypothetical protein